MRYIVFLIAYIYFLLMDLKKKEIDSIALALYAIIAFITLVITYNGLSDKNILDTVLSLLFGLSVYFLSLFSNEGIGMADGIYFIINGLLLSFKENIILFLTGLFVAFIIGVFIYYFKRNSKESVRLPFMPCFLPAIIGYMICTV